MFFQFSFQTAFYRDCVNGTLMPHSALPATSANYTVIHGVFQDEGWKYPMHQSAFRDHLVMPYDTDIIIYNKTKVMFTSMFILYSK